MGTVHKAKGLEFDTVHVQDDFVKVPCARHNIAQLPHFRVGKETWLGHGLSWGQRDGAELWAFGVQRDGARPWTFRCSRLGRCGDMYMYVVELVSP